MNFAIIWFVFIYTRLTVSSTIIIWLTEHAVVNGVRYELSMFSQVDMKAISLVALIMFMQVITLAI